MTQNTNPPTPEGPRFSHQPGPDVTGPAVPAPGVPAAPAPPEGVERQADGDGRPSNLVLAGAGSLVAVLAFLGGTAVGHAWDGSNAQQNQFGGPGDGGQFPGQQGQVPGQGMNGQGSGGQDQGAGFGE